MKVNTAPKVSYVNNLKEGNIKLKVLRYLMYNMHFAKFSSTLPMLHFLFSIYNLLYKI